MTAENGAVVAALNRLIDACLDGEKGYRAAGESARNVQLKTLLTAYANQRGQYAAELTDEVRRLGGKPEEGGTVTGALWRGWAALKAAVTGGDEKAIVAECERAADSAKETYEAALRENLPVEVRAIVQRQFAGIREAHDRIRALEVAAERL